jgi:hypothetical protein
VSWKLFLSAPTPVLCELHQFHVKKWGLNIATLKWLKKSANTEASGAGFGSVSTMILVDWVRIQVGKNNLQKKKKSEDKYCFEVLDVLF